MNNPYDKHAIKEILMRRDNMSAEEAQDQINEVQRIIDKMFIDGDASFDAVQELIEDEFGLEPDYIEAFVLV